VTRTSGGDDPGLGGAGELGTGDMPGSASQGSSGPDPRLPARVVSAMLLARRVTIGALRRWHRHEVMPGGRTIDGPVLFVGNHGFGGIVDVNVFAALATIDGLGPSRPLTILTHKMAWTFKVGRLIEAVRAQPASDATALDAFARGDHVLVFPGGDIEAAKPYKHRNRIVFSGRRGFARLARDAGVPIVPIVTAGAGESLLVVSDGLWLARTLRLDRMLRMKAAPISVSVPWGLNIGLVGIFLPYLPLPTKLCTAVLEPMRPASGETADDFGDRVESVMQAALDELTRGRITLLG
jgi:1-acyl-sn-glycerol-3-phosphate acyltransferase